MTDLADTLFSTPEMLSVFSGESHVRQMLAFEAGLARAQAEAGIIPPDAAAAIADRCRVELFDVAALFREAVPAGTQAIPLVRRLTELVEGDARKYVHWGATSQDVIDTATVLQIRDGLDLLEGGLLDVCAACALLAERHRHTPMAGRTLLQQALPITFGLKAARWLALATRRVLALRALRERALSVQLGGAAGTLASLGEHGVRVVELLAADLGLSAPDLPWHAERDRVAEVAATLGIVAGAMGKIAGDVVLLAQTEVGEVAEGAAPGKGGSSTLPQKRNPVDAIEAIAAARLAMGMVPVLLSAMVQEHERAAGAWQAEWAAILDLFRFTAGAVERVRGALAGLEVDPDRMRTNLELTGGLVMAESLSMALAAQVGKQEAHHIIQAASRRALAAGVDLREAALEDERVRAALSSEDLDRALDPSSYLGSTDTFIDRALDGYRALPPREPGR
jgi:3-carboxy-cis,cis-muconate cycloisomerase